MPRNGNPTLCYHGLRPFSLPWPSNPNPALAKITKPQVHHGCHQRIIEGVVLIQYRQVQIA
jgi:hypothetical protein